MALAVALRSSTQHSMIAVTGELDTANAAPLQAFLTAEIDGCRRDMIVDLRQLTFLDAAGLTALVAASTALAARAQEISVMCDSPAMSRLFVLTGLHEVLRVHTPV